MGHDFEPAKNMKLLLCTCFEQLLRLKINFIVGFFFVMEKREIFKNNTLSYLAVVLVRFLLDISAY
jgi:hypothetical protein